MSVTWSIQLPYDSSTKASDIPSIAEKINRDIQACSFPPDRIVVYIYGYGNYLYDLLIETYKLDVELGE